MAEPGRGLVAEAGMIAAEVLLVAKKSEDDLHRWVYLDIGKFLGAGRNDRRGDPLPVRDAPMTARRTGPCILAGSVLRQRGCALRKAARGPARVAEIGRPR